MRKYGQVEEYFINVEGDIYLLTNIAVDMSSSPEKDIMNMKRITQKNNTFTNLYFTRRKHFNETLFAIEDEKELNTLLEIDFKLRKLYLLIYIIKSKL